MAFTVSDSHVERMLGLSVSLVRSGPRQRSLAGSGVTSTVTSTVASGVASTGFQDTAAAATRRRVAVEIRINGHDVVAVILRMLMTQVAQIQRHPAGNIRTIVLLASGRLLASARRCVVRILLFRHCNQRINQIESIKPGRIKSRLE